MIPLTNLLAGKEIIVRPELARAVSFLKKYGMDYSDIDIDALVKLFLDEMDKGLRGEPSSLAMIPTYIEIPPDIPVGKKAIVLDAGGTNFRVAVVHFTGEKKPVIAKQKRFPMPGLKEEVSNKEFYDAFAGYMEEVRDESDRIGFCFSYPSEMLPRKDGRILHFSKEIKAQEALGGLVGEGLVAALKARGARGKKRVIVLNDTVTTLLAGVSLMGGRRYDGHIGFILGTGTNVAYQERNANIVKTPGLAPDGSQIINVETGDFSKGPAGELDRRLDRGTNNPCRYTFEKMHSGAYFGPLCLLAIQAACADGFFSPAAAARCQALAELDTKSVSDFLLAPTAAYPLAPIVSEEADRIALYALLDRLVERSAVLAAAALSAAVLKSGRGTDPARPVCVSAEGSTFFGLKGLRFRTEYYLKSYLADVRRAFCEIVSVEHATLVGAAIAGLTN
jgi:hexokinase